MLIEPITGSPCSADPFVLILKQNTTEMIDEYLCMRKRQTYLLGLTMFEITMMRHMVTSALCGALVGWERNSRLITPGARALEGQHKEMQSRVAVAGVRTLALISLGACAFTECSLFAFMAHPRGDFYDSARVAAQVCSGVGFLGGGVLIKTGVEVRGLTTAASIWLCAAVGMMIGGDLVLMGLFLTGIALLVLRLNRGFTYECTAEGSELVAL
jgi:uncharacterized membrane protein YhiD involved in acid resistance